MKNTIAYLNVLMVFLFFSTIAIAQDTKSVKDKKKVEKAYVIHEKSDKISRVDIRKDSRMTENIIQIDATNASGGAGMLSSAPLPPAEITGIALLSGSYNMTRELAKSGRGMSIQLLDVVFPCRVRLTVSEQAFDFEIKEAGTWKVTLGLLN